MGTPTISDEEFWQYVENRDDPTITQRVEQSEAQHQRAKAVIKLRNLLYRATCPTAHELGEYYVGQLPRKQTKAVQNHLNYCPYCSRELLMYNEFMGETEPQPVLLERMRVMIARLWQDVIGSDPSWQPTFATRGEEPTTIYAADEGIQIALRSQEDTSHPGYKLLVGLIAGVQSERLRVHLWLAEQLLATTAVDALGNFLFENLEPQTYELVIQGDALLIQIQTFPV
jgi:hypothetical protein